MTVALNWTEGKPTGEKIRCVGCRRSFIGWLAFETHGESGSCAEDYRELRRLGLELQHSNATGSTWRMREG